MDRKYDELYYKPAQSLISVDDFWQEYNANKVASVKKYAGNIFCPLCRKAELKWADGAKRHYFRQLREHDIDCDYRVETVNKKEMEVLQKTMSDSDIHSKLQTCMNRIIKEFCRKSDVDNIVESRSAVNEKKNNLLVNIGNRTKCLPTRKWQYLSEEDIGEMKVYQGKCKCYIDEASKGRIDIYVYTYNEEKYMGKIIVTSKVKKYSSYNFNIISKCKDKKTSLGLCVWGEPRKEKTWWSMVAQHSSYIVIEKLDV